MGIKHIVRSRYFAVEVADIFFTAQAMAALHIIMDGTVTFWTTRNADFRPSVPALDLVSGPGRAFCCICWAQGRPHAVFLMSYRISRLARGRV